MSNPVPNANVPQIPQPLADVGALVYAVRAIKQGMDSLAGYRGAPNDRAVTFNDLLSLGVVTSVGRAAVLGVTAIIAGAGLVGGTITSTGTISLSTIGAHALMGNPNSVAAVPAGVTVGTGLSLNALGTLIATGTGVTTVVAGAGLNGGTITSTGTISLGTIGAGLIMANPSVGAAVPVGVTVGAGLSLNAGGTLFAATAAVPRGYIAGLTLSNDATTPNTIIDISDGMATSSDATTVMVLSALTKTTGAWVVGSGNGGLDTGSVASSTWYHIYVIERVDTGVVDVLLSTSATAPTMPTSYTKKRRIGSIKTDGSGHIIAFVQNGDRFDWLVPVNDIPSNTPGVTTGSLVALASVPLGIIVQAILTGNANDPSSGSGLYLSSPAQTDVAFGVAAITAQVASGGVTAYSALIETDTAQHIRRRLSSTTGAYLAITNGWIDARGRNA